MRLSKEIKVIYDGLKWYTNIEELITMVNS